MYGDSSLLRMPSDDPPLPVRLHPLVLLRITQHANRAQLVPPLPATLGVLLGRAAGDGGTDIVASFEVVHEEDSGAVDWPAVRRKREQLAEVAPELFVAGWYGIGATRHAAAQCAGMMHAALSEAFEEVASGVGFALMVDTDPPDALASLPSHLFRATLLRDGAVQQTSAPHESEEWERKAEESGEALRELGDEETSDSVRGALERNVSGDRRIVTAVAGREGMRVSLAKLNFALESDEIEQVGVDAAMHSVVADKPFAPTAPQRRRMEQSLRMLRQRIALATAYLEEVESGHITQPNHKAMRHIAKACAMLPSSTAYNEVQRETTEEVTQTLMVALLELQTKCALTLNEITSAQSRPTWERKKETVTLHPKY